MLYSKDIQIKECYDLVVCGGGFTGFAAAYSAAREGLKVILIERSSALGGVGTNGLVNQILGERYADNGKTYCCVGGLFSQLEDTLVKAGSAVDAKGIDPYFHPYGWRPHLGVGLVFDNEKMKLLLEKMLLDLGVKILYMTDIIDVAKEQDKLSAVIVHNKSGLYGIGGTYFVDATGDADICDMAGVPTCKGDREGAMSAASLEMQVENVDWDELTEYMRTSEDYRFRALIDDLTKKGIWKFPYEIFISVMLAQKDVFLLNTIRQVGIDGTDSDSVSQGILDGRKENFRLLEIARTHFPGFKNATVREIAPFLGIRETRRIAGRYTLTIEDLVTAKDFADGIALSGFGWDLPNPKKPSDQPFKSVKRKSRVTQIPYGSLLPLGLTNLITAGRCISVEREVLGPVRVMGPCIAMGEAAGIAAALALRNSTTFDKVDVDALRRRIVEYGGFVDRAQVKEYRYQK